MSEDFSSGHTARRGQCKPCRRAARDDCQDPSCKYCHHPDHLPPPQNLTDLGGGNSRKIKKIRSLLG
eukprot:11307596-Karenia_brevis.AAC.1